MTALLSLEPVDLVAGRLWLRPPLPSDAPAVLRLMLDPQVLAWNASPAVVDEASAVAWCERNADWSDGTHASFTIHDGTSGDLLGSISLFELDAHHRTGTIGYRVAPEARGQGVAGDAAGSVTRWAFAELGIERIALFHAVGNTASCRVATKLGYQLEGVLRSAGVYGGQRHDEHLHARLATDL